MKDINNQINRSSRPSNIIIGGDFNAHHHIWGAKHITGKGREIAIFLSNNDLVLLNDGSITR
jgi:hypothetical protein